MLTSHHVHLATREGNLTESKKPIARVVHAPIETLRRYYRALNKDQQVVFAQKIGTSTGHLPQIFLGYKPCNAVYAIRIDKVTGGAVSMCDCRPDIDWEYVLKALKRRQRLKKEEEAKHVGKDSESAGS